MGGSSRPPLVSEELTAKMYNQGGEVGGSNEHRLLMSSFDATKSRNEAEHTFD